MSSATDVLKKVACLLADRRYRPALRMAQDRLMHGFASADLCNLAGICAVNLDAPAQAEQYWKQAIMLAPFAAQPYCNLGILLAKSEREQEAEQYYRQALMLANAEAGVGLGLLLCRYGRMAEAEECYRQAIAIDPQHAAAYLNLGVLLVQKRCNEEAEHCYRQALALDPIDAGAWSNLGVLLAERDQYTDAEQCHLQALRLAPSDAKSYSNYGLLLAKLRRDSEAEECYRKALASDPRNAEAHVNFGLLLERLQRLDEAEAYQRRAMELCPQRAEIATNLGNLLALRRHWQEAEQWHRRAIALTASASAYSNLGVMLADVDRPQEAEQCFRQALALDAGYQLAHLNLAFLLLRQGRFAEGWAHHEARYHPALPDNGMRVPVLDFPQWHGESLAGKSLLIWAEQGLGDQIQFCRYVPWLKQHGARHVTLACRRSLVSLFSTLPGVDAMVSDDIAPAAVTAHDYWSFLLSLPLHCGTALNTIPVPIPYLSTLPQRIARWPLQRLSHGLLVGLAWQGNRGHSNDRYRSLLGLETLLPLWSVPDVQFVSLQHDVIVPELDTQPLLRWPQPFADFADTAAVVQQLDLVITVDTAVAHLAGALGKPCWVLLPSHKTDWRWLRGRDDSPWYPERMRLFRQEQDDWAPVVARIAQALQDEFPIMSHEVPH